MKKKLTSLGFAVIYAVTPILVQLYLSVLLMVQMFILRLLMGSSFQPQKIAGRMQSNSANLILVALCNLVLIAGMGTAYYFIRKHKTDPLTKPKKNLGPKIVSMLVVFGLFSQYVCNIFLTLMMQFFPDLYKNYEKTVSGFDFGVLPWWALIFIVGIWSPMAEELVFRGMVYRTLRKGFGFAFSAILSAVIFGVYHMDVVQGLYAAAFGVVLAIVYEKTHSIWGSYVLHAAFNTLNYVIVEGIEALKLPDFILGLFNLGIIAVSVVGFVVILRKIIKLDKKTETDRILPNGGNDENI